MRDANGYAQALNEGGSPYAAFAIPGRVKSPGQSYTTGAGGPPPSPPPGGVAQGQGQGPGGMGQGQGRRKRQRQQLAGCIG